MKVELSASATSSATSSISKDDEYKIAYDLAKKKVDQDLASQKIKLANKSLPPLKKPDLSKVVKGYVENKLNIPSLRKNVSFMPRKGGCGCGR